MATTSARSRLRLVSSPELRMRLEASDTAFFSSGLSCLWVSSAAFVARLTALLLVLANTRACPPPFTVSMATSMGAP